MTGIHSSVDTLAISFLVMRWGIATRDGGLLRGPPELGRVRKMIMEPNGTG